MEHIRHVSVQKPASADDFQDLVCDVTFVLIQMLAAKGGSSPALNFIDDKCYLREGLEPPLRS